MTIRLFAAFLAGLIALAGCGGGSKSRQGTNAGANASATTGAAAAPDNATQTNPPGDIPDTQRFLTYSSSSGYSVLYPEGWSRATQGSAVRFTSNYDGEQIAMLTGNATAHLRSAFSSIGAMRTTHERINGNAVTLYSFTSQSKPDAVTGRSIRLENNSYVYTSGTRRAILDLWAPQGADNVDQWHKISRSFRWK